MWFLVYSFFYCTHDHHNFGFKFCKSVFFSKLPGLNPFFIKSIVYPKRHRQSREFTFKTLNNNNPETDKQKLSSTQNCVNKSLDLQTCQFYELAVAGPTLFSYCALSHIKWLECLFSLWQSSALGYNSACVTRCFRMRLCV